MIATAHISAGAAAGAGAMRTTKNIFRASLAAFIAGIILHIGLDSLPHSDYALLTDRGISLGWVVVAEAIAALALVIALSSSGQTLRLRTLFVMAWGIFGSALPDIKFVYRFGFQNALTGKLGQLGDNFHHYFHNQSLGSLSHEIGIAIFFFLLVRLLTRPDPA